MPTLSMLDRASLLEFMGLQQNIVNIALAFDKGDAPSVDEMRGVVRTLASKFERLRSVPEADARGTVTFRDMADFEAALGKIVYTISEPEDARQRLENLKLETMETTVEGVEVPLWRVVLLPPTTWVLRIDHALGDGLSLVGVLLHIGTDAASGEPLKLRDLSPLMRRVEEAGEWAGWMRKLRLVVWPPLLVRTLATMTRGGRMPPHKPMPLMRREGEPGPHGETIPAESYCTVYCADVPVALLRQLARSPKLSSVSGITVSVNDVIFALFSDTISRYVESINFELEPAAQEVFYVALPIGNPLPPSLYGHETEGLCNGMFPCIVELPLSTGLSAANRLRKVHAELQVVKRTDVSALASMILSAVGRFTSPRDLMREAGNGLNRSVAVISNVPGPQRAVAIAGHRVRRIEAVVPHPFAIVQAVSYDGLLTFNIQLDSRTSKQPENVLPAWEGALRGLILSLLPVAEASVALEQAQVCAKANPGAVYAKGTAR